MADTPNLAMTYIEGSQGQKHVTHNTALQVLDLLVQAAINDRDLATPPGSPVEGSRYLVATSPTGIWSGHAGHVAGFYGGGWIFAIPKEGWRLWIMDEDLYINYNGSSWVADGAGGGSFSTLGVNTAADATNKLAVASSAILFNHIGTSVQVKLNKNAAGNSASFLFQTGFSGRAEFGTLGDDAFTLKMSPDGSTFNDAIKASSNGRVAYKQLGTGLTAAGSTQGTALALTKQFNEITTAAASTGVKLPAPEPGEICIIANQGASTLNIYPDTGGSIDNLSTNVAITLATNTRMILTALTATKWYSR